MYNTTTQREECRFCGLSMRVARDDKHPDRCPEMPMTDDVAYLKEWARHNGYIVYEDD